MQSNEENPFVQIVCRNLVPSTRFIDCLSTAEVWALMRVCKDAYHAVKRWQSINFGLPPPLIVAANRIARDLTEGGSEGIWTELRINDPCGERWEVIPLVACKLGLKLVVTDSDDFGIDRWRKAAQRYSLVSPEVHHKIDKNILQPSSGPFNFHPHFYFHLHLHSLRCDGCGSRMYVYSFSPDGILFVYVKRTLSPSERSSEYSAEAQPMFGDTPTETTTIPRWRREGGIDVKGLIGSMLSPSAAESYAHGVSLMNRSHNQPRRNETGGSAAEIVTGGSAAEIVTRGSAAEIVTRGSAAEIVTGGSAEDDETGEWFDGTGEWFDGTGQSHITPGRMCEISLLDYLVHASASLMLDRRFSVVIIVCSRYVGLKIAWKLGDVYEKGRNGHRMPHWSVASCPRELTGALLSSRLQSIYPSGDVITVDWDLITTFPSLDGLPPSSRVCILTPFAGGSDDSMRWIRSLLAWCRTGEPGRIFLRLVLGPATIVDPMNRIRNRMKWDHGIDLTFDGDDIFSLEPLP